MAAVPLMFGGNFAPRNWALCDGQLLSISSNQALFSLLGTTYGGDGRSSFGLPDLRGRVAIHEGPGPGLSLRPLGQKSGAETNILNTTQLPSHNHTATTALAVAASTEDATSTQVAGNVLANTSSNTYTTAAPDGELGANAATTVGNTGENQSVNNIQPYQVVNFIIALQGIYPSRS